jgi:predicted dehydrogenase
MDKINWGMIGCGDVTEIKSGPAFNKVKDSELLAVMGRNEARVKDYAERHQVPAYYTDLSQLLAHPGINAIYIATPPDTHLYFAQAAFQAGKHVYVEKPMTLDYDEALLMQSSAAGHHCKLVVAHYRRAQPMFNKVKDLLDNNAIGNPLYATLNFRRLALTETEMKVPKTAWRINPAKSGGGLFHDMAPHQIGLLYYFFGAVKTAVGFSANQSGNYLADDLVTGLVQFENGVHFTGAWNFSSYDEKDELTIFGTEGSISFCVFDKQEIELMSSNKKEIIQFEKLPHVQQPLIEHTVQYFLEREKNPCPAEEGLAVMSVIDAFTSK